MPWVRAMEISKVCENAETVHMSLYNPPQFFNLLLAIKITFIFAIFCTIKQSVSATVFIVH